MQKLRDLNNLHSLMAIVSALRSSSVYRLTKTWDQLKHRAYAQFERLGSLVSDQDNYKEVFYLKSLYILGNLVYFISYGNSLTMPKFHVYLIWVYIW